VTGTPLFRAARGNNFYVIFENFARNNGDGLPFCGLHAHVQGRDWFWNRKGDGLPRKNMLLC